MAQTPTLCEVSYGFDKFTDRSDVSDDFYTPYRLSLSRRPRSRSLGISLPFLSDNTSGRYEKYLTHYTYFGHGSPREIYKKYQTRIDTPSPKSKCPEEFYQEASSYYDFLRDYYIAKSSSPTQVDSVISPQLPQRYYVKVPEGYVSSSLVKYSSLRDFDRIELNDLPTLTRTGLKGKDFTDQKNSDTLTWVDSLNAWISTRKCLEQKPYMSIVHNPPYIEKWFTATQCRNKRDAVHTCKGQCDRYHNHMLTFEEICTRRCEQKAPLNPRLKHYRNAVLERVNKKETERPRNAYSTPVYNSDVHTCRRKTTPLSAGAIQTKQSQDEIDKEDDKNEQINKDEEEEKEEEEEESSEHELIEKLTEVFGKDTSPSPTNDKDVEIETSGSSRSSSDSLNVESGLYDEDGLEYDMISSRTSIRSSSISSHSTIQIEYVVCSKGSEDVSTQSTHDQVDTSKDIVSNSADDDHSSRRFTENSSKYVKHVSEEIKIRRKIKTFMKKEVFEVHKAEKKLPQKAKVERKPKDRQSVKPPPKVEKSKVKAPIQQISAKPKPKKTSKIQSWVAPPKVELKSQDAASSKSNEEKEEKKAKTKELPTKPTPTAQTESTVTPPSEYPVSTSVTQEDDQSEINVKTDEDISVEQTNQQTNQAVEDVEDNDAEAIKRRRSPVRKRERIVRLRTENELNELPPEPKLDVKKQANWIYGDDKDDTPVETVQTPLHVKFEVSALPTAPDIPEVPVETPVKQTKCHIVSKHLVPVDAKPRWGNKKYDKSYDDERHRAELAERRRKKQMDMYEKLKLRKSGKQSIDEDVKESASFDEYDFLAKYCIFNKTKRDMIQHAFDIVDEEKKGWLNGEDIMVALRIVNSKLTETEEEYLSRIIEMTGYKVTDGADFKLFSVLSALSTRISLLDSWMKNLIGTMDFKTLEMKLFICKTLWECNVDHETNTIPLEQVMIELRAGGVSYNHECQVKKKLSHLKALDLFDFLTYVPLFIMIHEAVVDNPLDESRIK